MSLPSSTCAWGRRRGFRPAFCTVDDVQVDHSNLDEAEEAVSNNLPTEAQSV